MGIKSLKPKFLTFLNKYKYIALILCVGMVLMMIPTGKEKESNMVLQAPTTSGEVLSANESLAQILSAIAGAGKVEVLLTVAAGEQTIYQTDDVLSVTGDTNNTHTSTVIITDEQRNEIGLIRQINPPVYQGAIVVCQGAESPTVRLSIVDAVSKVTGLGADRITVLKMK